MTDEFEPSEILGQLRPFMQTEGNSHVRPSLEVRDHASPPGVA